MYTEHCDSVSDAGTLMFAVMDQSADIILCGTAHTMFCTCTCIGLRTCPDTALDADLNAESRPDQFCDELCVQVRAGPKRVSASAFASVLSGFTTHFRICVLRSKCCITEADAVCEPALSGQRSKCRIDERCV